MVKKDKVLVIVNSNATMCADGTETIGSRSQRVADYYAQRRGLTPHQLAFDLGYRVGTYPKTCQPDDPNFISDDTNGIKCVTAGPHYGKPILQAVSDYVKANGIEAVLTSSCTPVTIERGPDGIEGNFSSFNQFLAFAVYFQDYAKPASNWYAYRSGGSSALVYANFLNSVANLKSADADVVFALLGAGVKPSHRLDVSGETRRTNQNVLLCGRIGYPMQRKDAPQEAFYSLLTAEPYEEAVRIINDAAESEGSIQTHANKPHFIGITDYVAPGDYDGQYRALYTAHNMGLKNLTYTSQWTGAYPVSGKTWVPDPSWHLLPLPAADTTKGQWESTTWKECLPELKGHNQAFCYCTSQPNNYWISGELPGVAGQNWWADTISPLRGAWANCFHSSAGANALDVLYKGGCAGVATTAEPFTSGIPSPADFLHNLLRGLTMAEALMLSPQCANLYNVTIYGDPLYAPYKNSTPPTYNYKV